MSPEAESKIERKGFAAVDAKWIAIVAPFATPDGAFTNPNYPGVYIEPHSSGKGALLSATDGMVLIQAHDPNATVDGPLWLKTPKALIRACREPKGPKLIAPHVFGYQSPSLPNYLRPGKLIVHISGSSDDPKNRMEVVTVSPVKPHAKTDEGGFYAMSSNDMSREEPIAKVCAGTAWMQSVLKLIDKPAGGTGSILINEEYLLKVAKVGRLLDRPVSFTFHGEKGVVGFQFDRIDEGFVRGGIMPMELRQPESPRR